MELKCEDCHRTPHELVQTNRLINGVKINTKVLCGKCTVLHWLIVHYEAKKKYPKAAEELEKIAKKYVEKGQL